MNEQLTNYQLFQLIRQEYNWMRSYINFQGSYRNDVIQDSNAFDQIESSLR